MLPVARKLCCCCCCCVCLASWESGFSALKHQRGRQERRRFSKFSFVRLIINPCTWECSSYIHYLMKFKPLLRSHVYFPYRTSTLVAFPCTNWCRLTITPLYICPMPFLQGIHGTRLFFEDFVPGTWICLKMLWGTTLPVR